MNRLFGIAAFVVVAIVAAAVYFHFNPHHIPSFITTSVQGFQLPEPRSPMTNFRPPQF